jgi:hypothetical protein
MRITFNFLILSTFILLFSSCNNSTDFDSEKWKSWEESEINMHVRWDMVDNLMSNTTLKGMSIVAIAQLLGSVPEKCFDGDCSMSYDLGPCRTGISYGSLTIQFKNGKVYHVEKHCG